MHAAQGQRPQASAGAGGGRHRRPGRRSARDGGGDPSAVVEVSVPQMRRLSPRGEGRQALADLTVTGVSEIH